MSTTQAPKKTHRPSGVRGGSSGEQAIAFLPSLKRVVRSMAPEKWMFLGVFLLSVISIGAAIVGPKILGRATDVIFAGIIGKRLPAGVSVDQVVEQLRAAGQGQFADMISGMRYLVPGEGIDFELLASWVGLALGLYLASALLGFIQYTLVNRALQRAMERLRNQMKDKLDRLPLSYFDAAPRGELLSRMTNDIDNLAQVLQHTTGQLLDNTLLIIGITVMLFTVSPLLAIITLLALPVSAVVSIAIGRQAQKQFATMWRVTGTLNAEVEEAYTGHSLVKVFGRQTEVSDVFDEANDGLYQASFKAQFISGLMGPVNRFVGNLSYVIIAVVGGLQVANGHLPLGNVQAAIQYSRQFTQPIGQIASMANQLQSGIASAERVFEVLDADEMSADTQERLPETLHGGVEFHDVHFSYEKNSKLIEALSLRVKPGQSMAIVGPTGAGKTTLVNLIERFYELDGGSISIDGIDISTVSRRDLRSRIGMVLQDTWLFSGTIAENIAYGKPGATHDEVVAAAKAAHVDDFVCRLPDGYETVIDPEGGNISAGEKQLITIARAFIADPDVLILDEATSSVDTRTELLVQEAMNRLRSQRTSFVIAHRLSTIRDADIILVMRDGSIVEHGSHDDLIARHGAYYELYQAQFEASLTA